MREYVTQAIILERAPHRELDARVSLWSRDLGKMWARATSLRKITSKLSAHLEPGLLSELRLVENRNLQVVDALKVRRLNIPHPEMRQLARLLEHGEPEEDLWTALTAPDWSWRAVLGALGWDPRHAACAMCGSPPGAFSIPGQEFFCGGCASKAPADAVIYIQDAAV